MTAEPSRAAVAAETEDLRVRLAEAEEVLRAIRNGEVDAVVVTGERGERVYTLTGTDHIYRELIETMNEGAVTLSADGIILYCNDRFAKTLQLPLQQVLGTAVRDHLAPADQRTLDAILTQARTQPSRREISLKTREGRLVPIYLSASCLQSEGTELLFCLVMTDLTEQKRHDQIEAAERQSRLILEQAAEAIIVCDEQGRVIRTSQAAVQLSDGNPLLRPFDEVFPLRTGASDPFQLASLLQGGTFRNVDVVLARQGYTLDLILNAGPLRSGQETLGCVITLTDITDRKQAEERLNATLINLERSNKDLEQFAYAASHDLQEPLRMIASFLQLLEQKEGARLEGESREFIDYAIKGALRLRTLINDLLDFSRIQSRSEPLVSTDLHIALGEALANLNSLIMEKGAIVTSADLPTLLADKGQMIQLFQNIIGNALKFHGVEPPLIFLTVERRSGEWVISVRDNGIGIEPQYFEKIFQLFQRLHTNDDYSGTGIGLALCKRIVERHGGRIWVESEAGRGTTFCFTLPEGVGLKAGTS